MNIQEAIQYIIQREALETKDDLDRWCGSRSRTKLYADVAHLAPQHWQNVKEPEACVRATYERHLFGYKLYQR